MKCPSFWQAIACIVAVIISPTTTADVDDGFCETFCSANSTNTPIESPTKSPLKPKAPGNCKKIVCYYTNTKRYKGAGYFGIDDIDPSLCSHIIYSSAILKGNRIVAEYDDEEGTPSKKGNYEKFVELKNINPSLKVLLRVLSVNDKLLTAMIANGRNRQEFIGNAIAFLRKRGFDGIHVTFNLKRPTHESKRYFSLLCQELRKRIDIEAQHFDSFKLLMTTSVNWYRIGDYDIPALNAALDIIDLPVCGLEGYWGKIARHHSPLFKGSFEKDGYYFNVEAVLKKWLNAGLLRSKTVAGLCFASSDYKLDSTDNTDVLAPAHGKPCIGPYSRFSGAINYYEVCQLIDGGAEKRYIYSQKVPYLVSGDNWIGYDDEKSLREKVKYVKDNDLGGVLVSWIHHDDFSGAFCKAGKYPLLSAINEECSEP